MGSVRKMLMYTAAEKGGHARYTYELLSAMAAVSGDYDVALLTSGRLENQFQSDLYTIHRKIPPQVSKSRFPSSLAWKAYLFALALCRARVVMKFVRQDEDLDAVHFQEYTPWLAPSHFRQMKQGGKKIFFTVHNIVPHSYYLPLVPKGHWNKWNRDAWRECDALFVHSPNLRSELAHFLGENHPNIYVTPHGIWSTTFHEQSATDRHDARRLLFFGVMRPNKGLHVLLEAMKELPDFKLTVAGEFRDPAYETTIRAQIDMLPKGQVELIARFVDDCEMNSIFAASSAVVLPYTEFSSQSGVLHDAMSHHLPVVVTSVGALADTVSDWGVGRVVQPGYARGLATAVRELFQPAVYREAITNTASVAQAYSWTETARQTFAAYDEVFSGS